MISSDTLFQMRESSSSYMTACNDIKRYKDCGLGKKTKTLRLILLLNTAELPILRRYKFTLAGPC